MDWEIEVVAVVGKGGRHIAEADAWDALAGVTGGQDLSERLLQLSGRPAQFSLGKSHAGFGPTGPWIVTPTSCPIPTTSPSPRPSTGSRSSPAGRPT